jgi:hypothetical protein
MTSRIMGLLLSAAILTSLSSCTTVRGWFGGGDNGNKQDVAANAADGPVAVASKDEAESRLQSTVKGYIMAELRRGTKAKPDLVHRRPYFYKEYVEYPDGADKFDIQLRDNDSRTRPFIAEVKVNKIRFSTRMHRKRDTAEEDGNFLRDTGTETLNYELRNGRWHRLGGLYVAAKTEENLAGEWVPRRDDTVRVNPSESKPGWFKRTWSKITGKDIE